MSIKWINRKSISHVGERTTAIFIAPIHEEAFYRLVLQGGIVFSLTTIGIPSFLATAIGVWCQSFQFALSHDSRIISQRFSDTMLAVVILGLIQTYGSFPEAVLTHTIYNLLMSLEL